MLQKLILNKSKSRGLSHLSRFNRDPSGFDTRSILYIVFLFVFLLLFNFISPVYANHIPAAKGYVNDFAGVLTQEQKNNLESSLAGFEKDTSNEIAVGIIKSLNGENIDDFTVRVFEEWKIGKKGKDNGVLLLIAIDDRKLRIEVGYGAEQYLTDGEAGDIIRNIITPSFKKGDYYVGISDGVSEIKNQLSSINARPVVQEPSGWEKGIISVVAEIISWIFLIFFFQIIVYVCAFFGRSKSIWLGGLVGGAMGGIIGFILKSIIIGGVLTLGLGVLGLFLDWILSRRYQELKKQGKETDWWRTGGGFFGGGGGSGGGGGFGGFGGGGSGGGGSSGGW